MEWFPFVGAPYSVIGGIAFAALPAPLLARMIPTLRSHARQETAMTAATVMPAMAPEARSEEDFEVLELFDACDTSEDEDVEARFDDDLETSRLLDGLDTDKNEDVVASALD